MRWLSEQAEAEGIDIFTGFAGTEVLYEGTRVVGVRTGDRGIDKHGERKGTFEPGVDITAAVTIFADGVRGNLTKTLIRKLRLDGPAPQTYAIAIKELWEIPPDRVPPGRVVHTMGHPLRNEEFGGGFIYALPEGRLAVGFVVGLDYRDPLFDPHTAFQRFKQHPLVSAMLTGGQMTRYGAKALPEGGWHAIPRCHVDGALIVGGRGRVPELDSAQGDPPGDEERDSAPPRLRSTRCAPVMCRRRSSRRSSGWSMPGVSGASCTRCGTSIRRSAPGSSLARRAPGWYR